MSRHKGLGVLGGCTEGAPEGQCAVPREGCPCGVMWGKGLHRGGVQGDHCLERWKGTLPHPFPKKGRTGSNPGGGSPHHPLPLPDDRPGPPAHTWRTPRPKSALTPGIVRWSHQPELHFPRCSGVPRGGVHFGWWWGGGVWGRHVPPLPANAEPGGEVTCRCLALLCAPGSVGAQSVARRLGRSRWVWDSREEAAAVGRGQ